MYVGIATLYPIIDLESKIETLLYKYEYEWYGIKIITENIFVHRQLFQSQEMETNVLFIFSE